MNRKPIIIAVVIALAIVGGVFAYQYFSSGGRSLEYNSACADPSCGWTGSITVVRKPGAPYPPVCPKCGKNSVLPLATCPKCGHKQLLNEEIKNWMPNTENLPSKTVCTQCGGPIKHGD